MRDSGGQGGRSPGGPGSGVIAKRLPQPCHQRTQHPARVIVTPHHSHDSLACEGRRPEGRGACGRAHSRGLRCLASSPLRTPPRPLVPQARFTSTSPHAAPREVPPNTPWQHLPQVSSACLGLRLSRQVLLTSSQEFTQPPPPAAHRTGSSKGGKKKLRVHSQKSS